MSVVYIDFSKSVPPKVLLLAYENIASLSETKLVYSYLEATQTSIINNPSVFSYTTIFQEIKKYVDYFIVLGANSPGLSRNEYRLSLLLPTLENLGNFIGNPTELFIAREVFREAFNNTPPDVIYKNENNQIIQSAGVFVDLISHGQIIKENDVIITPLTSFQRIFDDSVVYSIFLNQRRFLVPRSPNVDRIDDESIVSFVELLQDCTDTHTG